MLDIDIKSFCTVTHFFLVVAQTSFTRDLHGVQQRFSWKGWNISHVNLSLINNVMTRKRWPTCAVLALLYYCYYWSSWSNWISWFMAPATRRSFPWLLMGKGGWGGERRDDFWGWHWCLTGLRGAVKTKPLINAIDQQKNRGKCDLHTARVINALTDFFSHPPPSLKSDFLSFQSERERVQTNVDRLGLSQTRIQSILLDGEGWSIAGETT